MYMFTLFKIRRDVNTCVYLHSHSLQVIKPAEHVHVICKKKKKIKESHELPLLLRAVEAQTMVAYQPYTITELCKQHLQ